MDTRKGVKVPFSSITSTPIPTGGITIPAPAPASTVSLTSGEAVMQDNLYALYVEARHFKARGRRIQLLIFTPHAGRFSCLRREQMFNGNRARWATTSESIATVQTYLSDRASVMMWDGDLKDSVPQYTLSGPIICKITNEEYQTVLSGKTSSKTFRTIDREISSYGISIK